MKKEYIDQPISAEVDFDQSLGLETNTFARSMFNHIFIPILNSLPKGFKHIIKKTSNSASVVIDYATTHKALEVLYSNGDMFSLKSLPDRFFKYVWFNINNSKAVRNRLKFVKREIKNHLDLISKHYREIEIISIASGSSRSIIEVVKNGDYIEKTRLSITFLDKNESAIKYSKNLSESINHSSIKLNWVHDSVNNFLRMAPTNKFDIVEIVGLLDYFTDEKTQEIFTGIHKIMQPGGILITSNVVHNSEEEFVTKVIDWPMIYKDPVKLAELVKNSGFEYNNIRAFYEPLKIHGLVVARK
ncbi:MAG: class I SAM-dependent methyltransferase [Minisyncoccia bacterium]